MALLDGTAWDLTGNRLRETTCSKGSQVRPKPWAAAVRTQPQHMGRALNTIWATAASIINDFMWDNLFQPHQRYDSLDGNELVVAPLWSRLNHLNEYWMDCQKCLVSGVKSLWSWWCLLFHVAPSAGQNVHRSFTRNFVQTFMVSRG